MPHLALAAAADQGRRNAVKSAPIENPLEGTAPMPDDRDPQPRAGWRFDQTINVPTMVTLVSAIVLSVSAGVGVYSNLKETINKNTYDIAGLNREVGDLRTQLAASRSENEARQQVFRNEFRADLKDIKDNLEKLGMRITPPSRQQLHDWS